MSRDRVGSRRRHRLCPVRGALLLLKNIVIIIFVRILLLL